MEKQKCLRCDEDFVPPDNKTNVCANCADDLKADMDAYTCQIEVDQLQVLTKEFSRGK